MQFSAEDLRAARLIFRRQFLAVAALPLAVAALLMTGWVIRRRNQSRRLAGFLAWSGVAGAIVIATAAALVWLSRLVNAPAGLAPGVEGLAALALVALLPMSWWWRRPHRLRPGRAPVQFVAEQIIVGLPVAACLWLTARLLRDRITPATLSQWQQPLFPFELSGSLYLAGLFLAELALYWTLAMLLAAMAGRWRLSERHLPLGLAAGVLWLTPTIAWLLLAHQLQSVPRASLLVAGAAAALFALGGNALRRRYRRATQATRLALLYGALLLPLLVLYPLTWFYADSTARALVEQEYAPKTARRPQDILEELTRVQGEIDRIPVPRLMQLVAPTALPTATLPILPAFDVWSQTSLAETRMTSAIELYGANLSLASRFALNVPQYRGVTDVNLRSRATTCTWNVFGEAQPFGSEERDMLHAEREICDASGHPQGAIIVHVINDYQALPFVSTANPYRDALRSPGNAPRGSALTDLQVVVYGWSFSPIFTSGNVAWPITPDLFTLLYRSRTPFWTQIEAEGRAYDVYFSNDKRFVYAIGYPAPTPFQHLTRLAEAAALTAAIFVLLLAPRCPPRSPGRRPPASGHCSTKSGRASTASCSCSSCSRPLVRC